jgi:hypothetical protein
MSQPLIGACDAATRSLARLAGSLNANLLRDDGEQYDQKP